MQGRQDLTNSSAASTAELAQSLETLVSNWANLQKKVDTKVAFYTDIHTLHEDLKSKVKSKKDSSLSLSVSSSSSFLSSRLDILHVENVWLDALQNHVYSSSNNGADAEEISEELDVSRSGRRRRQSLTLLLSCWIDQILERLVKTHSKSNYDQIFEIADRLQATKVSLPATNSQINQFRIRWEQLHDDVNERKT